MLPLPPGVADDVLSRPLSPSAGLVAPAVALAATEAPDVDGEVLGGRPAQTPAEMGAAETIAPGEPRADGPVVLGTDGSDPAVAVLPGSTSRALVHRAGCPVVVVRPVAR